MTTKATALDLFFSRDDLIDKFLYASVTGNGARFKSSLLSEFPD